MTARAIVYCLLCGVTMMVAAAGAGSPVYWYVAGVVMSGAFVPVVLRGPQQSCKRFAVIWAALIVITAFCTWTEALIFVKPDGHALRDLLGAGFLYTLLAVALAFLAGPLRLVSPGTTPASLHRPGRVLAAIVGCGVAYLVYYYVFGAIAFQLFTKSYYTGSGTLAAAAAVVGKLGLWFPLIQVGRGALMTLAVLPAIATLRMSRARAALTIGMLMWVIGGLAPLIPPTAGMPAELRLMHIVEIFTQNFTLGITAVLLLRPAAHRVPEQVMGAGA